MQALYDELVQATNTSKNPMQRIRLDCIGAPDTAAGIQRFTSYGKEFKLDDDLGDMVTECHNSLRHAIELADLITHACSISQEYSDALWSLATCVVVAGKDMDFRVTPDSVKYSPNVLRYLRYGEAIYMGSEERRKLIKAVFEDFHRYGQVTTILPQEMRDEILKQLVRVTLPKTLKLQDLVARMASLNGWREDYLDIPKHLIQGQDTLTLVKDLVAHALYSTQLVTPNVRNDDSGKPLRHPGFEKNRLFPAVNDADILTFIVQYITPILDARFPDSAHPTASPGPRFLQPVAQHVKDLRLDLIIPNFGVAYYPTRIFAAQEHLKYIKTWFPNLKTLHLDIVDQDSTRMLRNLATRQFRAKGRVVSFTTLPALLVPLIASLRDAALNKASVSFFDTLATEKWLQEGKSNRDDEDTDGWNDVEIVDEMMDEQGTNFVIGEAAS